MEKSKGETKCLKWGIIGAGMISHDFVVALQTLPAGKHRVTSICDLISKSDAEKFAKKHNISKVYTALKDFLKNDDDIDVVYIGTIHVTHHEIAMEVLASCKPTLCEKPLSMNLHTSREMISTAKRQGVFLMEASWMRFFPAVAELRQMIANNDIGDVKFIRANFSFRRPPWRDESRLTNPKLGGGSVLDVGVYTISLATMIFRERPVKIYAQGTLLRNGVDDMAVVTLTYSGGRIAQLSCSISYDIACDAVICGTKNELQLPHPFWCPTKLETPKGVYEKPMISKEFPLPEVSVPFNYPNGAGLRYEAEEVYDCIMQGKTESDIMPLHESEIVAEITEEVLNQIHASHVT